MEFKKTSVNLVPDTVNPTPDYYCTWQTQLYSSCDGKPPRQRMEIGERALFDTEKPYGWAYFYPEARRDLFIVMDDSWDIPPVENAECSGSLYLDKDRFPEATSGGVTNAEAMKKLTDRIKAIGWKGLGGWICCQESPLTLGDRTQEEYWTEHLTNAREGGFSYWKVDWGQRWWQEDFRRLLTDMDHKLAPDLVVEHAMTKNIIPYSDTYRTYDVPGIMSIPMTMYKLAELAHISKAADGYMGLINCEDEAYIAAAGGYAMGIMRHPYAGSFTDGRPDPSFPDLHRNIKTKITEVTRAVRWHRIAPAFGTDPDNIIVDKAELSDTWQFVNRDAEIEAWWLNEPQIKEHINGDVITKTAPARISRGCALPEVRPDGNGNVPFIVAAKNPNGAFSVVTAGRTFGRDYRIPKCDVSVESGDSTMIGIFGEYNTLTLNTSLSGKKSVLIQDLASDEAFDITEQVTLDGGRIVIPGELIGKIGTMAQPAGDTSEPGVIIELR